MRISDWSSDVCSSDLRYSAEAWRSLLRPSAETFTLPTASAEKLPPSADSASARRNTEGPAPVTATRTPAGPLARSEEHTSELQSLMRYSYAVFCLNKKNKQTNNRLTSNTNSKTNQNTTHSTNIL